MKIPVSMRITVRKKYRDFSKEVVDYLTTESIESAKFNIVKFTISKMLSELLGYRIELDPGKGDLSG